MLSLLKLFLISKTQLMPKASKRLFTKSYLYFIYSKVDLTYFLQNKKYFYAFQIHIPFGILYPRHAIIFHLEDWSKPDEHLESTL